MPIEQAAEGFFGYAFGDRFHCQDGVFVAVDPADGEPALRFTFHNNSGKVLLVDVKRGAAAHLPGRPARRSQRAAVLRSIVEVESLPGAGN